MTIKKQFYILITLVCAAVLLLMLVNQYNTKAIIEHSEQRINLGEISSSMLMLRRHEKDFLARKDLKYADKFAKTFSHLEIQTSSLNLRLKKDGMTVDALESAAEQLTLYNTSFSNLVKVQQKIGLNAKDGLYGKLRASVHLAESLLKKQQAYQLTSDMLMLRRNEKDFMLRENLKYLTKFDKNVTIFKTNLGNSNFDSQLKSQVLSAITQYDADFRKLVTSYEEKGLTKNTGFVGDLRSAVHNVELVLVSLEEQAIKKINAANKRNEMINFALSLILLGIILTVMIYISRSIRRPIDSFSATILNISKSKDLTIRSKLSSKNEIGKMACSFDLMLDEIQSVLLGATQSAGKVSQTATTMLVALKKTTDHIAQQQTDNQNISNSIDSILETTTRVTSDASKAEEMSQEANNITDTQSDLTAHSITEVRSLADEIKNTAQVIAELEQESVNISLVLNVITEVSEQTNLLALNAAIEAARAGDQGRGFSVVADEVRLLAQRSQSSTEQIRTIIEKLQSKASIVSLAIQAGSEKMAASVKNSEDAGESFKSISNFARSIRDINKDISTSAQQQSSIAQTVTQNVAKVFESTDLSVKEVLHSAKLSEELSLLSRSLDEQIHTFKVA